MNKAIEAGRYECAALPAYGIKNIHATLDPSLSESFLTVSGIHVYRWSDETRIMFDRPMPAGSPALNGAIPQLTAIFYGISDSLFDLPVPVRAFKTGLHIAIGNLMLDQDVWLTEQQLRSTPLVIGQDGLKDLMVEPSSSFLLGTPSHDRIRLLSDLNGQ